MSIMQREADAEVLAALEQTSDADLLRHYRAFTHRIHANETAPKLAERGKQLRAQRDVIEAELLRRMGGER